jgi:hypothetical protein
VSEADGRGHEGAKVLQIYEDANEIQRLVVARQAQGRDPIWPECMPGAEGVAQAESASATTRKTLRLKASPTWLPVTSTLRA